MRDRHIKYNRPGFGLVELMVTIGIISFIFAALMYFMVIGGTAWRTGDAEAQVTLEARRGMSSMTRELRQTDTVKLFDLAGNPYVDNVNYNAVAFQVVTDIDGDGDVLTATGAPEYGSTITYSVNGNGQLIRTMGGGTTVMANNVTGVQFIRSVDLLTVTLQISRTTPDRRVLQASLTSTIKMRD